MPIQVKPLTNEELAGFFARRPRSAEDVEDYIEVLRSQNVNIGSGLSLKTQNVKSEDGEVFTILDGSIDEDDPSGVTVRAAKRRFNMAARELGFGLDWRDVEGWIILRGVPLKAEEPTDGKGK